MKVFILENDEVKMYDPNITPLCLLLDETDKMNISCMDRGIYRFYFWNENYTEKETEEMLNKMRPVVNTEYEKERGKKEEKK